MNSVSLLFFALFAGSTVQGLLRNSLFWMFTKGISFAGCYQQYSYVSGKTVMSAWNVPDIETCQKMCQAHPMCDSWYYYDAYGRDCHMKNGGVVFTHSASYLWSGPRDCPAGKVVKRLSRKNYLIY